MTLKGIPIGDDYAVGATYDGECLASKFGYSYFTVAHFVSDYATGTVGLDQCLLQGVPWTASTSEVTASDCDMTSCFRQTGQIYNPFLYCSRGDDPLDCKSVCNPDDVSMCLYCHDETSCDIIDSMYVIFNVEMFLNWIVVELKKTVPLLQFVFIQDLEDQIAKLNMSSDLTKLNVKLFKNAQNHVTAVQVILILAEFVTMMVLMKQLVEVFPIVRIK